MMTRKALFNLIIVSQCYGDTQVFDDSNFTSGVAPVGGSGNWNRTDTNWSTPSTPYTHDVWTNAGSFSTAQFLGTAGTVTLNENSPITFGKLEFLSDGYLINTSTENSLLCGRNLIAGGIILRTEPGISATIACNILSSSSPNSINKIGTGSLTLSGTGNSFTRNFFVDGGGTLNVTGVINSTQSIRLGSIDPSANNVLNLIEGGVITTATDSILGVAAVNTGNSVLISDAGSSWTNSASFYVGQGGANNTLTVQKDGNLTVGNTTALLTGLFVGSASSDNQIIIQKGGQLTANNFVYIGNSISALNNSILVTDPGSVLNVVKGNPSTGVLWLGPSGSNNNLTLANGAVVNVDSNVTISNGTLYIGNGALPGTLNINSPAGITPLNIGAEPANLVFNHIAENYLFNSIMQDTGELNVFHNGPGTTILTAQNINVGPTTINLGTLKAGGVNTLSAQTEITVNPTGALNLGGYSQTIKSLLNSGITDFGGLTPGAVLTSNEGFIQTSTGTIGYVIGSFGVSDLLTTPSTAALNGTLQIDPASIYSLYTPYQIIHATSGVSNAFSNIIASPLVKTTIDYESNDVYLSFRQNLIAAAVTHNERVVSHALDAVLDPKGDLLIVLDNLVNLSLLEAKDALNALGGEQYTYLVQLDRYANQTLNWRLFNTLRNTLSPCYCFKSCNSWNSWQQVEVGQAFAQSDINAKGLETDHFNATLGSFATFQKGFVLGGALNYEHSNVHFNQKGTADRNSGQAALYGAYTNDYGYLFGDLMMGYSSSRVKRMLQFGEINRTTKAKPGVINGLGYVEMGANFLVNLLFIQPFIAGEIGFFDQGNFCESGADSLNLCLKTRTTTLYDTCVGFHITRNYPCLILNFDLAWQHRYGSGQIFTDTSFSFGDSFTIYGTKLGRDAVVGALNISKEFSNGFTLYGQCNGQAWQRFFAYGIELGLNYSW